MGRGNSAMNPTFLTCTNCGQRSSDTKRCKHCGRPFGRTPQPTDASPPTRSRLPGIAMIGLVAIIAVGIWRWQQRPLVAPVVVIPETTIVSAPPETTAAAPAPATPPPVQQEVTPAAPVDTVRPAVPARAEPTPPVTIDLTRQRYANTWANVRAERSSTSAVLQVLDRGEIVAIDSLEGGWYRVTTDRPTVGYVDQQFLDTLPP